ncbi:alpha/beta hydrolase [Candidimonas sp. SYP-B2681]|nr:alpha/beta hydrolase [Candidimonas sp. SYP-B2681]
MTQQGFATVDATRLYYESTGKGEAILFIHEYAGDHRSWEGQVRHFSRRFQCVTFNARGYPPSDVPAKVDEYSMQQAAVDAVAVLDALGVERAHIVGLSMGSFAALQLAMDFPERCLSAVVVGCGTGAEPSERTKFQDLFAQSAQKIQDVGIATYVEGYAMGPARKTLLAKDPRGWMEFKTQMAEHHAEGSRRTLLGVQSRRPSLWDLQGELAKIDLPVLLITGDRDEPTLMPNLMLNRSIPRCGLAIIPRSGHAVNLEEPQLFNQLVDDFIFSVTQSSI